MLPIIVSDDMMSYYMLLIIVSDDMMSYYMLLIIVSDEGLGLFPSAHDVLLIPPGRDGDVYCLHVDRGAPPLLTVVLGLCSLNGQVVRSNSQARLPPGWLITSRKNSLQLLSNPLSLLSLSHLLSLPLSFSLLYVHVWLYRVVAHPWHCKVAAVCPNYFLCHTHSNAKKTSANPGKTDPALSTTKASSTQAAAAAAAAAATV